MFERIDKDNNIKKEAFNEIHTFIYNDLLKFVTDVEVLKKKDPIDRFIQMGEGFLYS